MCAKVSTRRAFPNERPCNKVVPMPDTGVMSNSLRAELDKVALAHRVLEMEGHGDKTLGHMSLRDPDGRGIWLKRKAISLGETMGADDFVLLDFGGKKLAGEGETHNEWPIHTEIMRSRPEINVVAHTHPFHASIFSAIDEPLRPVAIEGGYFYPDVPRFSDSAELINTAPLGQALAAALGPAAFAILMKNHGATFAGTSTEHCTVLGICLEIACRQQLAVGASGFKWSTPDDEGMRRRGPQTFHQQFVDRSWGFYCRKLAYAEGDARVPTRGFYKL